MNIIRYACKNILRNPFLSVSSVFSITLLIFFVHILLFVLFVSEQFISNVNKRISFTINVRDGYDSTDPRIGGMMKELRSAFSGISLTYITREDALALLASRDPDLANLVENTEENPLPNSLKISEVDIASYVPLNNYIARYQDVLHYDAGDMDKKLLDYRAQYDRIMYIVSLLHTLKISVYVLLSLFILTVAVIIYMIIQNFIYFLHSEIEIIELVGGSSRYIYGPFIIQGSMYAGIATILSISLLAIIKSFFAVEFVSGPLTQVVTSFHLLFVSNIWILFLFFSCIGAISAWIASRRYIHSTIAP